MSEDIKIQLQSGESEPLSSNTEEAIVCKEAQKYYTKRAKRVSEVRKIINICLKRS